MITHPFRNGHTSATFRSVTEKTLAEIEALENDYVLGDARYIFIKSSDPGREIQIQTMLFDIPQAGD